MIKPKSLALIVAILATFTPTKSLLAASDGSNKFAVGEPAHVMKLPPGQLRTSLIALPPSQRQLALASLQRLDFPEQDVAVLHANADGDLFYADYGLATTAASSSISTATANVLADVDLFTLHSNPGSANVLFLDFDGEVISHTAWNKDKTVGAGVDPLIALPYDPSANDSPPTVANFTDEERKRIHEIWYRVAVDYSAFDIDVTTEEPAIFTSTTGHVLFTHDSDANGIAMPFQGAGGVSWIGVFGTSRYAQRYSPVLVYYTNLSSTPGSEGDASFNAESASHEFGHNLNLSHDGSDTATYYQGHDSGWVGWGAIMGSSYRYSVTQWSQGEYPGANNTQDDLAVIAGYLGYDADAEGNTADTASALAQESNGNILVSDPELDPANVLPYNKGVIEDRDDIDWWYLDVGAGALTLTVTPSWHAFNSVDYVSSIYRGNNLDVSLELYDASLELIDSNDPLDNTDATVNTVAAAGRYYLRIDGVGNDQDIGYSDYASIGMYYIEGNYQPAAADTAAPTPNPIDWFVAPHAVGSDSMDMVAATASDPAGVEYDFICAAGGAGCVDSGWQAGSSYHVTGLTAATYYAWKVRVRDGFNNQSEDSPMRGDTTMKADNSDVPPDGAPSDLTVTLISCKQINLAWQDNSSNEDSFQIERSNNGRKWSVHANVATGISSYQDADLKAHGVKKKKASRTWYYRVFARNEVGDSVKSNTASGTIVKAKNGACKKKKGRKT